MNTDYAPSEIASYIVRRPEEGTVKQKEKSKYRKLWISGAWCIALAMVLACSWYGIARQAAAHDEAEISVQTVATVDAEAATQEAARSKAEAQTTVMQKVQEVCVVQIPSGTSHTVRRVPCKKWHYTVFQLWHVLTMLSRLMDLITFRQLIK